MTFSIYTHSVPQFQRMLSNLETILKKALEYAEAKKIDPSVLINARLFPDMFPLVKQVQITCDFAKGASARLAGVEVPKFEDNETSFEQLEARIAATQQFIGTLTEAQFNGAEVRPIHIKVGAKDFNFVGSEYLAGFVLPNFYFHLTTAYAILRHNGVDIGKWDYMGVKP
jgi:uncharacterized protein